MKISLDPMQGYVKNGKFDQRKAFCSTGVKAAVCFKEARDGKPVNQEMIREEESEGTLINRGINTLFMDHTTPSEHQIVSLEITGIPKALCMVLNNEKEYDADERSLRYTEVEPNKYISKEEVTLYNKWLLIFENLIKEKYYDFYLKTNKTEKMALKAIHKLAQENARYMVSVFMPTTITYTVPWIQLNKIMVYMKQVIANPENEFERLLAPYFEDFINQLKQLDVAITKDSVYRVATSSKEVNDVALKHHPEIEGYKENEELLYKNNKDVSLSLFANKNKFSGIFDKNEFGHNVSFNNYESFACLAQEQRHRTISCEMIIPDEFKPFIPPILKDNKDLVAAWIVDMTSVQNAYPQGQLLRVNRCGSIKNILKYVAQERCCERAQLEIEKVYHDEIIPSIYDGLKESGYDELSELVLPYVKKLRCAFPSYHCPGPCGHPRDERDI